MARFARIVIPNLPHHVIQRGNRRQDVFFSENDKYLYIRLLQEQGRKAGMIYWAYCLMNNHVHLVAVPKDKKGLAKGIGEVDRRYSLLINSREGWRGYLWQGRFISYPMDERHLVAAVRYIERNPVRVNLVKNAEDYVWSSARTHVHKIPDPLVSENPPCLPIDDWADFLRQPDDPRAIKDLRHHARTGRPLGDQAFLVRLEKITGIRLRKRKPGPKAKGQRRIDYPTELDE
jgi:putative transposase